MNSSYLTNQNNIRATKPRLLWYSIARLTNIQSVYISLGGTEVCEWGDELSHKPQSDGLSVSLSNLHRPKKKYNAIEKKYKAMREYQLRLSLHAMYFIHTRTFSIVHITAAMSHWQTYDEMRTRWDLLVLMVLMPLNVSVVSICLRELKVYACMTLTDQ